MLETRCETRVQHSSHKRLHGERHVRRQHELARPQLRKVEHVGHHLGGVPRVEARVAHHPRLLRRQVLLLLPLLDDLEHARHRILIVAKLVEDVARNLGLRPRLGPRLEINLLQRPLRVCAYSARACASST